MPGLGQQSAVVTRGLTNPDRLEAKGVSLSTYNQDRGAGSDPPLITSGPCWSNNPLLYSPNRHVMNNRFRRERVNWRQSGKAPDYRFSLANERTYLAWTRTALALLVGAIGIDQLTPDLASPAIQVMLTSGLCVCAGLLSVFAYRRWAANEESMRKNEDLKYTSFIKIVSFLVFCFSLLVTLVVLL